MHVTPLAWGITLLVLFAVLVFDVVVIGRRPHEPSMRECTIAITVYVVSALLFAAGVFWLRGTRYGGEFLLGWLTEYSLSIDNLFIFLIIMAKMRVPRHLQQYALMIGIILALVLRGVFIALGATLISQFAWVFFIFGAFLVYTAVGLVREYLAGESEDDVTESFAIRVVRSRFRFTEDFHGKRIQVKVEQRRRMTPMFLVIVALGSTDLMFALDSIPAIYGLTKEPFLVFTANVFALMGLRQLYFLLGNMLRRLVYLSLGLSVILAFIGAKLLLHAMHEYHLDQRLGFNGELPMWLSLLVIVGTLVVTTVASLIASSRNPELVAAGETGEAR